MIIYKVHPLPDYLEDNTLSGDSIEEKINNFLRRWVQFTRSLTIWKDSATFSLRYVSGNGVTNIYFIVTANDKCDEDIINISVSALLKTYRILIDVPNSLIDETLFEKECQLSDPVFTEITQEVSSTLWEMPKQALNIQSPEMQKIMKFAPNVVYCWTGPSGTFMLPMELMASFIDAKQVLTISFMPTIVSAAEQRYLATMAKIAASCSDFQTQGFSQASSLRIVDPTAELAGRLYSQHLNVLIEDPVYVLIQCASERKDAALMTGMVASLKGVVHEQTTAEDIKMALPTGLRSQTITSTDEVAKHKWIYKQLSLNGISTSDYFDRLPYLTNAKGAATLFRLPINVRSGVPGTEVRQPAPDFHPGPKQTAPGIEKPTILLGQFKSGGNVFFKLNDLTRHALITGFTGSGKTITVFNIIKQIWADHGIPFLVIEAAKKEYRELIKYEKVNAKSEKIKVYTLGNECCAPLRLNPFQLLKGIRVESHISKLQICFEATIPPIGPSSSVIAEALVKLYKKFGWPLTTIYSGGHEDPRQFPKMDDFLKCIEEILLERGYLGEVEANVRAAIIGRFKPLTLGSKGYMYNVATSSPAPEELFSSPTILELEDLNPDEKALASMFILTLLREYCSLNNSYNSTLQHVTIVEEAHNVLSSSNSQTSEVIADTRTKAVETFCNQLAELRALGEGLIIVDQSPSKLARDAIRNTNLQLAHQLRDKYDREEIGSSVLLDDQQQHYLGKLPVGVAAVFMTGNEKGTFIKIPYTQSEEMINKGMATSYVSDDSLKHYMVEIGQVINMHIEQNQPFTGCEFCRQQCKYMAYVYPISNNPKIKEAGEQWFRSIENGISNQYINYVELIKSSLHAELQTRNETNKTDVYWCVFVHAWNFYWISSNSSTRSEKCLTKKHYVAVTCRQTD